MMTERRVTVNGQAVTELGTRADPDTDDIRVDGRRVRGRAAPRYLLVYKPRGFVTTRSDPERRRTVLDLLLKVREYVYPIGRLDYDSEGLLLLTNDGDLAQALIHPSHEMPRVYEAVVRGVPSAAALRRLAQGVTLDGRRTAPAGVRLMGGQRARQQDQARVEMTLNEGRNRQVRRMFDAIGHPVMRLRRVQIGPIRDRHLAPGEMRDLTVQELGMLRRAAGAAEAPVSEGKPRQRVLTRKPVRAR
jgi:pseudouridine synthase